MGLRRCRVAAGEELLDLGQDPVGSVNQGAWSTPSTSRYCAPGMWSARYRLPCTGT